MPSLDNFRPADHYHTGAGVAWVKRFPHACVTCPATLPAEVFDRLQGGKARRGFRSILALRVYDSAEEAMAALREALHADP